MGNSAWESVDEDGPLDRVCSYDVEPTGQLQITRSPGYNGDDDFITVEMIGRDADEAGVKRNSEFLDALIGAQRAAFGAQTYAFT